jgi:hypothetical protein
MASDSDSPTMGASRQPAGGGHAGVAGRLQRNLGRLDIDVFSTSFT